MKTMRRTQAALTAVTLAGALLSLPQAGFAAGRMPGAAQEAQAGNSAASDAANRLKKKQFNDVKVTVDGGIATLTGSVEVYEYKADAEKQVRRAKGITAVRNEIEVGGASVPDQELQSKLQEKLQYDRVGYGNTFDAITVSVQNGVVTIGGHSHDYPDRDSALGLVSTYPGVRDVVDQIEVDPASFMDERTRIAVARAVYGYPTLNRYAIDPAQPIRISVQNGNVELYGLVNTQADKETAYIRANGVPGIFSVKNYLQVANQSNEGQKQVSVQ